MVGQSLLSKDRGGFTYWIVEWDVLHYRIGLWLSDIFSAIELSENRISYWRIQETIGLLDIMDIRSRPQSIGLSDMGLRKNYRLPTSDTCIQCARGGG
jgi:hypothetical protein